MTTTKPKGSNTQPSQRLYVATGRNASRRMRVALRQFAVLKGRDATVAEKSALAYFTIPMGRE